MSGSSYTYTITLHTPMDLQIQVQYGSDGALPESADALIGDLGLQADLECWNNAHIILEEDDSDDTIEWHGELEDVLYAARTEDLRRQQGDRFTVTQHYESDTGVWVVTLQNEWEHQAGIPLVVKTTKGLVVGRVDGLFIR